MTTPNDAGRDFGTSDCSSAAGLYSVGTWDVRKQSYTPQAGLSGPAFNMTFRQLVVAVRELRRLGYSAHRIRDTSGGYENNDWSVLIERTDGKHWKEIRRNWRR